jgi:membrane protease YdiL (CAAX protease family)
VTPILEAITVRTRARAPWAVALGLTASLTALAVAAALRGGFSTQPAALTATASVLAAMLFLYMAFATTSLARDVRWWLRRDASGVWQAGGFFVACYLAYALGTASFAWPSFAKIVGFVAVPTALLWLARERAAPGVADFAAVLCLWLPFDLGWLKSIWTWPAGGGAYLLNTMLAINLALLLFVGFRQVDDVRFNVRLTRRDLGIGAAAFVAFAATAIPFGLATGFLTWNAGAAVSDPARALVLPLGILLTIAVPEELLFRGLLQNFLLKVVGRPVWAVGIASVLFGLAHVNNGPTPDWRYVALATLAGVAYGWTYHRTRSLLAPALVHAAVDTLWVLLLHV